MNSQELFIKECNILRENDDIKKVHQRENGFFNSCMFFLSRFQVISAYFSPINLWFGTFQCIHVPPKFGSASMAKFGSPVWHDFLLSELTHGSLFKLHFVHHKNSYKSYIFKGLHRQKYRKKHRLYDMIYQLISNIVSKFLQDYCCREWNNVSCCLSLQGFYCRNMAWWLLWPLHFFYK